MPPFTSCPADVGGLLALLQCLAEQIPILFPSLLLFYFLFVVIAGYTTQNSRTGSGNIFMWLSIASTTTTIGAFILYLIPRVLDLYTIGIGVALTILFTILFFFNSKDE